MTLLGKFRGTGDPVALEQVHEHGFRSGEMLRGSNPFEELHRVSIYLGGRRVFTT